PLEPTLLGARVQQMLRLKEAEERADRLAKHLLTANRQLEDSVDSRDDAVRQAQDALLFAMAKMAEARDGETPGHLQRIARYSVCLAEQVKADPAWSGVVDRVFLEQLQRCAPLHDIGKVGLPDHILLKPGPLDSGERQVMEQHPLLGCEILEALGNEFGESLAFLGMARGIVRSHHERWDGRGYPDKLSGEAIPAAARRRAPAAVCDALRPQPLAHPP